MKSAVRRGRSRVPFVLVILALWALWQPQRAWAEYRQSERLAPGIIHMHITRTAGPVEIDALIVDLSAAKAKAQISIAGGQVIGLRTVSRQAESLRNAPALPLAGVNGDFFYLEPLPTRGDMLGFCVHNGGLISAPSDKRRSALAILDDGQACIGVPVWQAWVENEALERRPVRDLNAARGFDSIVLYTPAFGPSTLTNNSGVEVRLTGVRLPLTPRAALQGVVESVYDGLGDTPIAPDTIVLSGHGTARPFLQGLSPGELVTVNVSVGEPFDRALEAVGGGPRLLRDGVVSVEWEREGFTRSFATDRHPRTAAGVSDGKLILVTADGRQPGYSVGMTLYELAELLRSLGATDALNLDGGGSTTLWEQGALVNAPSEDVERAVANALFMVNPWPAGKAERVLLSARTRKVLVGSQLPLGVEAWDEYGNRLGAPEVVWTVTPAEAGTVSSEGVFEAKEPGAASVAAQVDSARAALKVEVLDSLVGARLRPEVALLMPGEQLQLLFEGLAPGWESVAANGMAVRWALKGRGGQLGANGEFVAGQTGEVDVSAEGAGQKAKAWIAFGAGVKTLEDFEALGDWHGASYPKWVPAYFRISSRQARHGRSSGQLRYDFSGTRETVAAYAAWGKEVGAPAAIGAAVYGDGGGHLLRCRLVDANGKDVALDMSPRVDWSGEWRQVGFRVPADLTPPIKLMSVYVAETKPENRNRGLIYIDDLRAFYVAPSLVGDRPGPGTGTGR